jgi:hypothetical protein
MNTALEQPRKASIGLKVFLIALAVYGSLILGGYLLSIVFIVKGGKPLSSIVLGVNLVIFITLMWIFLINRRKMYLKKVN